MALPFKKKKISGKTKQNDTRYGQPFKVQKDRMNRKEQG